MPPFSRTLLSLSMSVPHIPGLEAEAEPGVSGGVEKPPLAVVDKVGPGALGAEQIALEGQPSSSVPPGASAQTWESGLRGQQRFGGQHCSESKTTARRAGCLECRKQETGGEQSWGPSGSCLLACWGRTMRLHPGLLFAFL